MSRRPPRFRHRPTTGRIEWRDPPPPSRRRALARRAGRLILALAMLGAAGLLAAREWAGSGAVRASPPGAASPADAPPTLAGVARVNDGDTITIGATRIRLHGIDAPEFGQMCTDAAGASFDCGRHSADELERWSAGRRLACQSRGTDRHGRVLARCAAPDGADLGGAMLAAGWAVAFSRDDAGYAALEAQAAAAKAGLWAGRFERPRAWRDAHAARSQAAKANQPDAGKPVPAQARPPAAAPAP